MYSENALSYFRNGTVLYNFWKGPLLCACVLSNQKVEEASFMVHTRMRTCMNVRAGDLRPSSLTLQLRF